MNEEKSKRVEADDDVPRFRQIQVQSLNEGVMLTSNYDTEDMDYLADLALRIIQKVKDGNDR